MSAGRRRIAGILSPYSIAGDPRHTQVCRGLFACRRLRQRAAESPMHRCAVAYDSVSDLMAFGGVGSLCVLIFSMQPGYRPPGAIFFLLRRRKNMERKTPLRAGGPSASVRPLAFALQMPYLIERERGSKTAPFTLSLPGARSNCVRHRSRTLYQLPGRVVTASVVRPGVLAACRFACAYDGGC